MEPAELDALRRRGRIRELCDALERAELAPTGDPYRDGGASPVEEAARRHELGRWQWHAARMPACERNLTRALALREAALGASHPDTLDTMERIAALHHYLSRDDAGARFEAVLSRRDGQSVAYAITLRNWGAWLRDRSDHRAADVIGEACELLHDRAGSEHPEYVAALKAEAHLHVFLASRHLRSLALAEHAFEVARRAYREDHPFVAGALLTIVRAEIAQRRFAPARAHLDDATRALVAAYGDAHPLSAIAIWRAAEIAIDGDDDLHQGALLRERAWDAYQRVYPSSPTLDAWSLAILELHLERRDGDAAQRWLERARAGARRRPQQAQRCALIASAQGLDAIAAALGAAT